MFGSLFPGSGNKKSGHILLVEDDRLVSATEVKLLRNLGYTVTLAPSGRDAIDYVKSSAADIDMILMDIDLGHGMDGTSAARDILKIRDLPIIFLSGISDPGIIEQVDDVFSYGFIVKGAGSSILDASIKMAFRLHKATVALKSKENELLLLFNAIESSGNAMAISGPDAVLLYVNPAFLKMWGYNRREEVIGRPAFEFWNESDQASFVAQSVLLKGGWSGELTAKNRDGECFTVDVNTNLVRDSENTPAGIVASFRSNVSRKLAAESVLESEEKFRSIYENALEGIYQTTPEGRYLNMNPSFANMFGYDSPEEMIIAVKDIGQDIYVDPEVRNRLKMLLAENSIVRNFEAEVFRKNRSKFWISLNARAVFDKDGIVHHYEGTNIDITDRKIYEMRLNEQKQKLEEMNIRLNESIKELEEKNQQLELLNSELLRSHKEKELLLREVNHRIKNNLNMIAGLLYLESDKLPDANSKAVLSDVGARINSISAVYDRLYQSSDIQNVDLADYFKSLSASIFNSYKPAGSSIDLRVSVADIRLDVKRCVLLGLILNELISNSLKHGYTQNKSGTVTVTLEESEGIITLVISDDGIGMKSYNDEDVSTGLNLVRMLVRQVGGTAEFAVNTGTSVIIKFRR